MHSILIDIKQVIAINLKQTDTIQYSTVQTDHTSEQTRCKGQIISS